LSLRISFARVIAFQLAAITRVMPWSSSPGLRNFSNTQNTREINTRKDKSRLVRATPQITRDTYTNMARRLSRDYHCPDYCNNTIDNNHDIGQYFPRKIVVKFVLMI
jgi:hypothetical protein